MGGAIKLFSQDVPTSIVDLQLERNNQDVELEGKRSSRWNTDYGHVVPAVLKLLGRQNSGLDSHMLCINNHPRFPDIF